MISYRKMVFSVSSLNLFQIQSRRFSFWFWLSCMLPFLFVFPFPSGHVFAPHLNLHINKVPQSCSYEKLPAPLLHESKTCFSWKIGWFPILNAPNLWKHKYASRCEKIEKCHWPERQHQKKIKHQVRRRFYGSNNQEQINTKTKSNNIDSARGAPPKAAPCCF